MHTQHRGVTGAALVLRGVRLVGSDGGPPTNVLIADARVTAIGKDVGADYPSLDADGCILVPGFVDPHLHLDKTFLWDDPNVYGTMRGAAFAAFRERKAHANPVEIKARMLRALRLGSQHGVTAVRAQIDVDDLVGLTAIHAALELRAECAGWLTLQVVAFAQEGLLSRPDLMPLIRAALAAGADAIGGGAGLDSGISAEDHLNAVFELAREFDVDVDLHPDLVSGPQTPPDQWELQHVARLTRTAGWEGRVVVSHLSGLGAMADESARRLAMLLREHGISVVTVPGAEFHVAAAWRNPPVYDVRQAITNVPLLLEEGVNLSLATGHVRDPLNPYGNADPLGDLFLLVSSVALGEPSIAGTPALDLVTAAPRRALRLPAVTVQVGQPADLVVLEAQPDGLPRAVEQVRHVLTGGEVVCRSPA